MQRLTVTAGVVLIATGAILFVASFIAIGKAQTWDDAYNFARESRLPLHRTGMLIGVCGLAALISIMPVMVAKTFNTPGFNLTLTGWIGFAFCTGLFLIVLGLTNIALPALGELAIQGTVSPQHVVDHFVRQPAIIAGFLGGNGQYLFWLILGTGLARSGVFMPWLGWVMVAGAIGGWSSFLHVPVIKHFGSQLWSLSVILLGVHLLWPGIHGV